MKDEQQSEILTGTVIAVQANYYLVKLLSQSSLLLCTRRALLKKMGQKVMVGDRVEVVEPDWQAVEAQFPKFSPDIQS